MRSLLFSLSGSISVAIWMKSEFGAFTTFPFLKKDTGLVCRKAKPRAPLRTWPSVVISTPLLRRPRGPRLLPSPSRVPRSGKRLQVSGLPRARQVHSVPRSHKSQPGGTGRGWIQASHGSLRVVSGRLPERGGSRRAARGRRPPRSEWRLQDGPARAEVHAARPATLKPVPRTAPWRR